MGLSSVMDIMPDGDDEFLYFYIFIFLYFSTQILCRNHCYLPWNSELSVRVYGIYILRQYILYYILQRHFYKHLTSVSFFISTFLSHDNKHTNKIIQNKTSKTITN